jgi:hypothetical protein
VVFEAPAGVTYQAFQFYDTNHGHALIPLTGRQPLPLPATLGVSRQNALLQLAVTEARFLDAGENGAATRRYLIGVRGSSRSPTDVVVIPARYVFAQTEDGCLITPETNLQDLSRPFGGSASFVPTADNEAQLVFAIPAGTRGVQLLLRAQNQSMDLPVQSDFHVRWPAPAATITDGSVLRVHLLPVPPEPSRLPPPAAGRVHHVLDVVLENLRPSSGVEFQPEQLRLVAADGSFIAPSPVASGIRCSLDPDGVIPAQTARRFTLVYDVPADALLRRVQYRGFDVQETVVDLP